MGEAKKKQRHCPAAGRVITAVECGGSRASRYACPADCPHNPWSPANYARALEIEDSLTEKMKRRLEREVSMSSFESPSVHDNSAWKIHNYFLDLFQRRRDANGQTFLQRWQADRFDGLNNDELFLLTRKTQSRLGLIEVHRILDSERVEVVDLLDDNLQPRLIVDRSCASHAVRFLCMLIWYYEMPHYCRFNGNALTIPTLPSLDSLQVLREVIQHLGGPPAPSAQREWIAEHYDRMEDAFHALDAALHEQSLRSMDLRFCTATYRLRADPSDLLRRLDQHPATEPDELNDKEAAEGFCDACVWFDELVPSDHSQLSLNLPADKPPTPGRPVLGRVLVAPERVRIEANSFARYQALRAQFEKSVGRMVEFTEERITDLASQLRDKDRTPFDTSLVPPRLLEHAPRLRMMTSRIDPAAVPQGLSLEDANAHMLQQHYRMFLDEPNPSLGDRTPRQAAADPLWRPRLLSLIKQLVYHHDTRNLHDGRADDINWLLRDLGLTEILFEPPPIRSPLKQEQEDFDEAMELPLPPPLPQRPLTEEEVLNRLRVVSTVFPTPEAMLDAFERDAPELFDLMDVVMKEHSDFMFEMLIMSAGQLWYVFLPPDTRPVSINIERLAKNLSILPETIGQPPEKLDLQWFERMIGGQRQPNVIQLLSANLLEACANKQLRRQVEPDALLGILLFLRALADELDQTLRELHAH